MNQQFTHMDAAESAFFARQLEFVKAQTYDIKYPNLMSRQFVPVSNDVNPGAMEVTYRQFDKVGQARIISNNAKDLPRVDVVGNEFTRPVRTAGDAYGWNIMELRAAMMAGMPLTSKRAAAARRAIEVVLDEVAAVGAPDFGIATGFTNDAAVPATASADEWADYITAATPNLIIAVIGAAYERMVAATNGVEKPDTIQRCSNRDQPGRDRCQ